VSPGGEASASQAPTATPAEGSIATTPSVLDDNGATQYVVVDIGGTLGVGSSPVAVGFDEMTLMRDNGGALRAYVDATQEQLEAASRHEGQ
jgi:hypothetical protein